MNGYLQLKQITKHYGKKAAVDALDLSIPKGCIYGLIGPNGAGKTTTIRMIMNIIVPDSGEVLVGGKAVGKDFKNSVGYLPEERGLYKKMTVKEVIFYMGQLKQASVKDIGQRIDPWLSRMNLGDYKDKKVEELSKGMQQKLQFITTLIHEPDIIILDELFSGLDPLNIELIKNVILELRKQGRTILFSTHVMEQAEKLCEYICMIHGGQKVLDGPLTDIKHRYGKNSIHLEIDGDGAFLSAIPGIENVTSYTNYYEIAISESAGTDDILKQIVNRVSVRRFERIEPSLYNIFIQLAGGEDARKAATPSESEGGRS